MKKRVYLIYEADEYGTEYTIRVCRTFERALNFLGVRTIGRRTEWGSVENRVRMRNTKKYWQNWRNGEWRWGNHLIRQMEMELR